MAVTAGADVSMAAAGRFMAGIAAKLFRALEGCLAGLGVAFVLETPSRCLDGLGQLEGIPLCFMGKRFGALEHGMRQLAQALKHKSDSLPRSRSKPLGPSEAER